jgi:CBS domain-containing protein
MKVEELMKHDVRTCGPDETLADAARIMWEADVGALPVVDVNRRPIAMITDRDICMAGFMRGVPLQEIKVSDAMSKMIATCLPETSVHEVEDTMRKVQIRRMPVVNYDGILVGIVTLADLAGDAQSVRMPIAAPGLVKTLAAITERRWKGVLAAE